MDNDILHTISCRFISTALQKYMEHTIKKIRCFPCQSADSCNKALHAKGGMAGAMAPAGPTCIG
jgi:hypothetical protein